MAWRTRPSAIGFFEPSLKVGRTFRVRKFTLVDGHSCMSRFGSPFSSATRA
jgi:hypothetical protein